MIGTLNMLGLAKRVGARFETVTYLYDSIFINIFLHSHCMIVGNRILLTSTSEVYGDPLEHPQNESYWGNVNPIGMFYFLL